MASATTISLGQAARVWARIGLNSFGGPTGQIAVLHRILVDELRWVSEQRFLHALNYCMLLPGPEAMQLVTYMGWLLHGYPGGIAAGLLFVLPGFIAILALSLLYAIYAGSAITVGLFFGLKAAVLAVVIDALLRIARRVLRHRVMLAVAALSFLALFVGQIPFPAVILTAGLSGMLLARWRPEIVSDFGPADAPIEDGSIDQLLELQRERHTATGRRRALIVVLTCCTLWVTPIVLIGIGLGWSTVFVAEAWFFSKAALVTFGGAYAVLAYVAQEAVATYGWLEPGEMLEGLGMAETTPGPLIQVVQFVGFLGAYRDPAGLPPLVAGMLGSLITIWVTYLPCFLWIFLGAPYIESLRSDRRLNAALSAITAAVVGVILNLALWFALHVLFGELVDLRGAGLRLLLPRPASLDPAAMALAVLAWVSLTRTRIGMLPTLALAALLGLVVRLLQG